ncbi:MAG: multidrug efflux SMR transporter [Alphaproteobacteria bacterium]|nr:multidrug efflux SMR transporter [Alphaproteobacteria bacterium]
MSWLYLLAAGFCEVVATTVYRYSEGLTKLWPNIGLIVLGAASLYFLHRSVSLPGGSAIPVGTAYAVWTGIGAAGTVIVGIGAFGEPADALRLGFLALLIFSLVGLKVVTGG